MKPKIRPAAIALLLLLLVVSAALAYSARTDIKPRIDRLLAAEWRHFTEDPLPVDVIPQIFDMGVADVDNDGSLDLYTSNHNYQQFLFVNDGKGRFRDMLDAWKLGQIPPLPGLEQSNTAPAVDRPGLYVYWMGDTIHLRLHRLEDLGPAKGTIHFYNKAEVVRNEGVDLRQEVEANGAIPQTTMTFQAARSAELVLYPLVRGTPITFRIDAPWARSNTFVGREAIVPQHQAGQGSAAARKSDADCPTCVEFAIALRDRHGMAWSDFNGDGLPDIFINRGALGGMLRAFPPEVHASIEDELLVSDGPGRYTERGKEAGIAKRDCSGRHVRWVDFDQDGLLDLFVNCLDRGAVPGGYAKQLYRQVPGKRFDDVAAKVGLALAGNELIDMVWFDADGDGRVDLFTNEDTGYYLYRLVDGRFVRERVHVGPFERAGVAGLKGNTSDYWQFDGKLSVADMDGNGRLDVFVASKRGNVLLVNEGSGTFKAVEPAAIGLPAQSVAAAWVDYDNDGMMDLHTVPQGIFRQDRPGHFVRTGLLALPEAKYQAAVINWFDRDNDGALDVVIALQENASQWRWWDRLYKKGDVRGQDNRFDWKILAYRNRHQDGHWLQVELKGAPGNPEAIGAAVAVNSGGRRQARQVGAHDGAYLSEGHYRLYYGLGSDKGPVELEIRWPDGTRQSVPGVAIDRKVKIQQPG